MPLDFNKASKVRDTLKEPEASPDDIFDESFMTQNTNFSTFQELLDAGNFLDDSGEISYSTMVGDMDEFVREHTQFDSWSTMFEQALQRWWDDPGKNRRDHPRRPCDVDVTLEVGSKETLATMVDVSKSGLQIKTNDELPSTRTLKVHIPVEKNQQTEEPVMIRGAVQWKTEEEPYRMGIEIVEKS